jgi:hypothetical protein
MNKRTAIIIVVAVIVLAGAGVGLWFFLKPASTPTLPQVVAGMPTVADLNSRPWKDARNGNPIPANTIVGVAPGGTVYHKESAWVGQLARGGQQINWVKNNGEKAIWTV